MPSMMMPAGKVVSPITGFVRPQIARRAPAMLPKAAPTLASAPRPAARPVAPAMSAAPAPAVSAVSSRAAPAQSPMASTPPSPPANAPTSQSGVRPRFNVSQAQSDAVAQNYQALHPDVRKHIESHALVQKHQTPPEAIMQWGAARYPEGLTQHNVHEFFQPYAKYASVKRKAFLDELEKIAYGSEPSPRGGFLLASHGQVSIPLRGPVQHMTRGVPMPGMEKGSDYDFTYNPGDFKPTNINKKTAAALSPAGRLASSRMRAMAPGSFARRGPSIAEVSKVHGFGRPLAGATKS